MLRHYDNMDKSSYLFMSKRKQLNFSIKVMEKQASTNSDISLDSLDSNYNKKTSMKNKKSDDNVDTILVPFYDEDVLIKIPKDQKRKHCNAGNKHNNPKELQRRDMHQPNSYLVNRDKQKNKRTSYLEKFRMQFAPNKVENKVDRNDISSLRPEFGDSERESIGEETNRSPTEFYNTESYNEMYYEKLINRDLEKYLENTFEEGLQFTEDITSKSPDDDNPDNLRSVSEVSQPRRRMRRATVQPIQNINLGGLGPDMEKIKPRLERARSLQRYSEKVRIENRLKIYKQSVQADMEKKEERQSSGRRHESAKVTKNQRVEDPNASYLMNKSGSEKKPKSIGKTWSKSADAQRTRDRRNEIERTKEQPPPKKNEISNQKQGFRIKTETKNMVDEAKIETKSRVKSSSKTKAINTEHGSAVKDIAPVQINFMVNVGGVRPSSALRTLEEKHRMYQQQVRAFMDNNG